MSIGYDRGDSGYRSPAHFVKCVYEDALCKACTKR